MVFGLFGKGLDLSIELDSPRDYYLAGEAVTIIVSLTTKEPVDITGGRAGLVFASPDDEWVSEEQLLTEEALPEGFDKTWHLEWRVPDDAAPSCKGEVVQQAWKIVVELNREMTVDTRQEREIRVVRRAPGERLEGGAYGQMENADDARMQFELSSLEFIVGEPLTGRLLIEPLVDIEAREVRLELWRTETLGEEDQREVEEYKAHEEQLAGITIMPGGYPVSYDFSLHVPADACPTFEHGNKEVSWSLKGVVSRPLAFDTEVTQQVYLYGAAAGS